MTVVSLLTGVCIWTFLTSIVTTLLIHLNAASSEYMVKITGINAYMEHRRLPLVRPVVLSICHCRPGSQVDCADNTGLPAQLLRQRIRDTYEARWKAEMHFDEEAILDELPGSLRIEVLSHLCVSLRCPTSPWPRFLVSTGRITLFFVKVGKLQVCMHMCADLIANVPFFEDAEEGFVTSLVTLLRPQAPLLSLFAPKEPHLLIRV